MNVGVIAGRVYGGIAEMDRQHGPRWVWHVDPDTLDMDNVCGCVVGQYYDDGRDWDHEGGNPYDIGTSRMGLSRLMQAQCGFNIDDPVHQIEGYEVLTRMWAYAIRRLRQLRSPQEAVS